MGAMAIIGLTRVDRETTLKKCILLCCRCRREFEAGIVDINGVHSRMVLIPRCERGDAGS